MQIYKLKTDRIYPYDKDKYIEDIKFHYSPIRGRSGEIQIDHGQGQAFIRIFNGEKYNNFSLGTRDACNILKNTDTNAYYVKGPPHPWDECESPFFLMRRDKFGAWHARGIEFRDVDLILGPSELISFELLKNAISFLRKNYSTREKDKLEAESLADFVCNLWYYPL